jgi:ATP-dependent protease ClpP protease subunit
MAKIQFTKSISNSSFGEDGFADSIVSQIEAVEAGEEIEFEIDSGGGEVYRGWRIATAISKHEGKTIANVTGIAASMSAVLLAFFDEVRADEKARIMLHKAYHPWRDYDDLKDEEKREIDTFNTKAYEKLSAKKGADKKFLKEVFLTDERKDHYMSAKEAKDKGLIDEVYQIKRKNNSPIYRMVAQLQDKINNLDMSLFSNKEERPSQAVVMADERVMIFRSDNTSVAKGNKVELLGKNEALEGEHTLKDGTTIIVNDKNVVTEVKEKKAEETNDELTDMVKALMAKVEEMSAKIADIEAKKEGEEEAKTVDELKDEVTQLEAKKKEILKAIKDNSALSSDFNPPNFEDKGEKEHKPFLGASLEHGIGLREVINKAKQEKE